MIKSFKKRLAAIVTVGPTVLWLGAFLMIPLAYVIGISFLTKNAYGGVDFAPTVSNYISLFQSEYAKVFLDSLWLSLETTVICLLVGYPFAYIIANAPRKWKPVLVLLLMLPFWTNSLIRTYGWNTLLRTEGIINHVLQNLGLIEKPLEMLYTDRELTYFLIARKQKFSNYITPNKRPGFPDFYICICKSICLILSYNSHLSITRRKKLEKG